jgi:hypothetical protein
MLDQEKCLQLKVMMKALDAVIFLPDYLMDECLSTSGEVDSEDMSEFRPAVLYMEQILRMFPKEMSCKLLMIPAFEESLMRIEESRNEQE